MGCMQALCHGENAGIASLDAWLSRPPQYHSAVCLRPDAVHHLSMQGRRFRCALAYLASHDCRFSDPWLRSSRYAVCI